MCTFITIAAAIWLSYGTPETIVFEDCGQEELRVSTLESNVEVELIAYSKSENLFYIEEK